MYSIYYQHETYIFNDDFHLKTNNNSLKKKTSLVNKQFSQMICVLEHYTCRDFSVLQEPTYNYYRKSLKYSSEI